jgi:hypothetical protein
VVGTSGAILYHGKKSFLQFVGGGRGGAGARDEGLRAIWRLDRASGFGQGGQVDGSCRAEVDEQVTVFQDQDCSNRRTGYVWRRGLRNRVTEPHLMQNLLNLRCCRRSVTYHLGSWLAACVVVAQASFCAGQDRLPPIRVLIAETLALCNVDRESNATALNDVAAAQCYMGEFAGARNNLLPFTPDNFFQQAAHQTCARIEIELTGSTASIPEALWNDGFGFMRCDAALAFMERGEVDKSLKQIDEIPRSLHSAFNAFGVKLVEKLKEAKKHDACRRVVLHWASCYEKTDSVFHYRDSHRVPELVAWLVEFDERAVASSLCERWHAILQTETDIEEGGEFIGRAWAEHALALNAMGDKNAARRSLDQARHWIEKARAAKFDPSKPLAYFDFAKTYAALGARQAVVLGEEDARATYRQAYGFAGLSVNPEYGEYVFEQIVSEQLTAGYEEGARETIKRLQTPRYVAPCWKRICEYELEKGNADSARAAARAAVEALDRDGFEAFMAQEMAPVAATAALAGEKEVARKLFQRALTLSEANETPRFNHAWIARFQVHGGMLLDAYRTIQSVEEPTDRTQPLARLCRELAKVEYVGQKSARKQNP